MTPLQFQVFFARFSWLVPCAHHDIALFLNLSLSKVVYGMNCIYFGSQSAFHTNIMPKQNHEKHFRINCLPTVCQTTLSMHMSAGSGRNKRHPNAGDAHRRHGEEEEGKNATTHRTYSSETKTWYIFE